jgi:hypothetical protein
MFNLSPPPLSLSIDCSGEAMLKQVVVSSKAAACRASGGALWWLSLSLSLSLSSSRRHLSFRDWLAIVENRPFATSSSSSSRKGQVEPEREGGESARLLLGSDRSVAADAMARDSMTRLLLPPPWSEQRDYEKGKKKKE